MPKFDISTKSRGAVALDATSGASIELMVSNRMGRKVHAHVRIEPSSDNAQAADDSWFRLDRSELVLDADASATVRVDIEIPKPTEIGLYAFRVFVGADTKTPDLDFTRSEPIAIRYAGEPSRAGVPWKWLLLAAGLAVVATGAALTYWWLTRPPECTVERSRYDRVLGECVCPNSSSEDTVGGVTRCVCDLGHQYDPVSASCEAFSCPDTFVFDERRGGCVCPDGSNEATVDGAPRCVCEPGFKLDPATYACLAFACPDTFLFDERKGDDCLCPDDSTEIIRDDTPRCVCDPGLKLDPATRTCQAFPCDPTFVYDEREGGCACPANASEEDAVGESRRCVCDPGLKFDPATSTCKDSRCPELFIFDERRGRCVCTDELLEVTADGEPRCVCDPGIDYDPNAGGCEASSCPELFIYDQHRGRCVCSDELLEVSVDGQRHCVCDPSVDYDPNAGGCEAASCPDPFTYDQRTGDCVCPDYLLKATVDGAPRCVCNPNIKYDPATGGCKAATCPATFIYAQDQGRCVCQQGARLDSTRGSCVDMADLAITKIESELQGDILDVEVFVTNLGRSTSSTYRLEAYAVDSANRKVPLFHGHDNLHSYIRPAEVFPMNYINSLESLNFSFVEAKLVPTDPQNDANPENNYMKIPFPQP
ncbi:hypothetical protein [Haliangium sp.]|uniref:hypothetical protein n=1 Tax=Haliangium sp. TaxID=2663208 RepID=UPI003D0DE092